MRGCERCRLYEKHLTEVHGHTKTTTSASTSRNSTATRSARNEHTGTGNTLRSRRSHSTTPSTIRPKRMSSKSASSAVLFGWLPKATLPKFSLFTKAWATVSKSQTSSTMCAQSTEHLPSQASACIFRYTILKRTCWTTLIQTMIHSCQTCKWTSSRRMSHHARN
ncbi:uncharacterized protein [Triticum aestivum]|uniref:uncharacterized protein n=1 Tax=Triticum aestivum TaxID=4565 RepID=UPI001D0250F2|nr:uncharacterized protein LOC123167625 [Triticum aestivum]